MINRLAMFDAEQVTEPFRQNMLAQPEPDRSQTGAGSEIGHLQIAAQTLGMNESDQAAALDDFLATGGQNLDPQTTAWCAAYVNAVLAHSGKEGTGSLAARSFLDWGEAVDQPQRGDVAVFSRGDPNGWQGHVGFFEGYNDDGSINVLGGNQGDAVSVASYPANRLLGFRRG